MAASRFSMAGTAQSCVIMDGRELTLEQPLRGSGADITCNKIGMIPSILITHGFCFLDGKRTEWNKLPSWLAHDDDLGITSADEPKSIQPQSCENEPTREAKDLAKHFETQHSNVFLSFQCAACGTNRNRLRQTACHFPKCRKRLSKKGDTSKTVHEGELRQADPSDAVASLSATSPLAPEDQAETDLRMSSVEADPSVAESTEAQFPCTICERNFKSKIGLGQHERHAHPDLRNTHRIQNVKQNKERKRVNRTRIEEVGSNTDKKPKSKPRGVWSEDEVKKLQALCEELAGTKNINKAIALHLPGKTNKQVSDKRKSLKDACKSKPNKGVTDHVATAVPLPTKAREQLTPEALLEQYTAEVCDKGAEETVGKSAQILRSVLSGEDPGAIQLELLRFIIEKNRKQLASEILDRKTEAAKCAIDPKVVSDTYQGRFGGESQKVDLSKYPKPKPANNWLLLKPFTRVEVTKAFERAKRDSAAGPDGIALDDLKSIDKSNAMLTNIFNVWLFTRLVPSTIKENRSILLPKGTEGLDDINNWRPLTISSVMLRLYTNILASRVLGAIPMNPRQRGFIIAPGCSENSMLIQRVMKHRKKFKKELCVVLLDLAKAFDTVSHDHLRAGLERFGVDDWFIEIVVDLYTEASTKFHLQGGITDEIPMTRGGKQGDPLCPQLFNIAMDPLLETIAVEHNGFKWDSSGL
ncbi:Hypothetical predicted protein [Mytilus galloprovincialis]|uniref:Reverse transcriptase domain-containing protein n=1 Tax=Mytilus galloprovincialis TaxID=29158 RepID=A0A8B6G3G4_MYTGA|nr:Hypothetical predicted protein [Mytilus galloprovincialis]